MPIPVPGDEAPSFADLMAQARTLIPALDPAWTDLNPSDPGVVLVELFAWLTEMMMFQAGQVPERNVRAFLALLEGDPHHSATQPIEAAVPQVILGLRERYRAVSVDDVRHLVLTDWAGTDAAKQLGPAGRVARVLCLPNRDLTASGSGQDAPGHLSIVVVPDRTAGEAQLPEPDQALLDGVYAFLAPRRLLTTRHHVVGPGYLPLRVRADIALRADAVPASTLQAARDALAALLDPLTGGPDGAGWPFGRPVHSSELYAGLEGLPGIDYVENLTVTAPDPGPADLVRLEDATFTGWDPLGRTYSYPPQVAS